MSNPPTGLEQTVLDRRAEVESNIQVGLAYLAEQMREFDDPRLALAAYNAGPGAVHRAGGRVPAIGETQDYVRIILNGYQGNGRAR